MMLTVTILVSGPVLKKQWRETDFLDVCLVVLANDLYLHKHWRVTHFLDLCSAIQVLVSGSDLLKH